jgi:hypothetical protein
VTLNGTAHGSAFLPGRHSHTVDEATGLALLGGVAALALGEEVLVPADCPAKLDELQPTASSATLNVASAAPSCLVRTAVTTISCCA